MASAREFPKDFGFKVCNTDVRRDNLQTRAGNRIPMDSSDTLAYAEQHARLRFLNTNSPFYKADKFEIWGAGPQVSERFLKNNSVQQVRNLRGVSGDTPFRALVRNENLVMLEPRHLAEAEVLLRQLASDVAGKHLSELSGSGIKDLLVIKIFDALNDKNKVQKIANVVLALRNEGFPVGVELATSFSSNVGCEPHTPYTDEGHVENAIANAEYLVQTVMPLESLTVSYKDMVGEMDPDTGRRLAAKTIERLKSSGIFIPLGFHLHDTGLAAQTYAAIIDECRKHNWPVNIDTTEGHDTGFASMGEVDRILKEQYNIDLGLTEEQRRILGEMQRISNEEARKFDAVVQKLKLPSKMMCRSKIPGGGYTSLVDGLAVFGLARKLGVSELEAVEIAAEAIRISSALMGYPYSVTPWFEYKRRAQENLLNNMIGQGYITAGMSVGEIKARIMAVPGLADEEIEKLFLSGLDRTVVTALAERMPAEELLASQEAFHKVVRKKIPLRVGPAVVESRLPALKNAVNQLREEGYLNPRPDHVEQARRQLLLEAGFSALSTEQQEQEVDRLSWAIAEHEMLARAIIFGDPKSFIHAIKNPWLREPLASEFEDPEAYNRAKKKFQQNINPEPDELDKIRQKMISGELTIADAEMQALALLRKEQNAIEISVLTYMKNHSGLSTKAVQDILAGSKSSDALQQLITGLYFAEKDTPGQCLDRGENPLYPAEHRVRIALDVVKDVLTTIVCDLKSKKPNKEELLDQLTNMVDSIIEPLDASEVRTITPGLIVNVKVKEGQFVKKGEPLATIQAMKMEMPILAPQDGVIFSIKIKPGDMCPPGQLIMVYGGLKEPTKTTQNIDTVNSRRINNLLQRALDKSRAHHAATDSSQQVHTVSAPAQPLSPLQKMGYFFPPIEPTDYLQKWGKDVILVVDNRATCAAKMAGDAEKLGVDYRILCAPGDETTPVARYAPKENVVPITGYMDKEAKLRAIERLAQQNPDKTIVVLPGYGFLSEDPDYSERVTLLGEKYKTTSGRPQIVFGGPPKAVMEIVGGKGTARDLVQRVAPEANIPYFNCGFGLQEVQSYISSGFSKDHPLHEAFATDFESVQKIGQVMIKAIAGGGGKGMEPHVPSSLEEYVRAIARIMEYAARNFTDHRVVVEQYLKGNIHHIEYQGFASNGEGLLYKRRNCTVQIHGQKSMENNVVVGDYDPNLVHHMDAAAQKILAEIAQLGYKGPLTIEFGVDVENNKFIFFEVNPRLQVEHPLSEMIDGKRRISIPVYGAMLAHNDGQSPSNLLEKGFGISKDEIRTSLVPEEERLMHFRIVSRDLDLRTGTVVAHYCVDSMWPVEISARVKEAFPDISIVHGGLGSGNLDAQIGTIVGPVEQVRLAAKMMDEAFKVLALADRRTDHTNLPTSVAMLDCIFNQNGNAVPRLSTSTLDVLMKGMEKNDPNIVPMTSGSEWPGRLDIDPQALKANVIYIGKSLAVPPRTQVSGIPGDQLSANAHQKPHGGKQAA